MDLSMTLRWWNLNRREKEIVRLLLKDQSNKEIAARLDISQKGKHPLFDIRISEFRYGNGYFSVAVHSLYRTTQDLPIPSGDEDRPVHR